MKRNEEDEIQILGTKKLSILSRKMWIAVIAVIVMLSTALFFWLLFKFTMQDGDVSVLKLKEDVAQMVKDSVSYEEKSSVSVITDSINDVLLDIYSLVNLKAELSTVLPNEKDPTVLYVAQIANTSKKGEEALEGLVLKGKQLSIDKSKAGYCAIINGRISLGSSLTEDVRDYCIDSQGYFFRQYSLVTNGQIQENGLKGKAVRRALAKQGNDIYVVESWNRESLYDFSEALADIGITDAIYLASGDTYTYYRDEEGVAYEARDYDKEALANTCFIIFRRECK